jgi:glycosidase
VIRDKHLRKQLSFPVRLIHVLAAVAALIIGVSALHANQAQPTPSDDHAPAVTKVEPPNWWIGLTPELMLLVSGHDLDATHVSCNLAAVIVERTQASAGGRYLFVWLKFGANLKSGTLVCRITTSTGATSFELPLAARTQTIGKFQGLEPSDAIYLVMPDRFANGDPTNDEPADAAKSHDRGKSSAYQGGDLRGLREHLPYLKNLGATAICLTSIAKNANPQDYHGYGAADFYSVDPHLGSVRDFQELINDAHQQHIKVLLHVQENNVGSGHPWLTSAPLPDWFHGTPQHHLNSSLELNPLFYGKSEQESFIKDRLELLVDPHVPPRMSRNLTEGWLAADLPDLNTENPIVAQYLLQNSIWWAESSGVDGYRIGTFPYVSRRFWAAWHAGLRRIYPRLTTIGEVFHPDPSVTSFFVGGQKRYDGIDSGLSTTLDSPLFIALRQVLLHGAPASLIADVLRHDSLYVRPDELVLFFGNHGLPPFADADANSVSAHKLALGLTMTLRGIPELFYGDEIGMSGGVLNRPRFPGGWPGDAQNAFTETGRAPQQQQILSYVQQLLRLRREHPALSTGGLWHLASDDAVYVFVRESEEERVLVAFNNAAQSRALRISLNDTPAQSTANLTRLFGEASAELFGRDVHLKIPAQSISIFLLN